MAPPQDEGTEDDEGGVVAGHGDGAAISAEAAGTGADDHGAHEPREAADHVHDAGAGEINHTDLEELVVGAVGNPVGVAAVVLEGREPAAV